MLRTCFVCRLFYEADRRPRLAARPENRPRRDLVAPVCCPRSIAAAASALLGRRLAALARRERRRRRRTRLSGRRRRARRGRGSPSGSAPGSGRGSMIARAIARPIHAQTVWNSLSSIIFTSVATTSATPSTAVIDRGRPAPHREPRPDDREELPDHDGDREERHVRAELRALVRGAPAAGALARLRRDRADPLPRREHLEEERDGRAAGSASRRAASASSCPSSRESTRLPEPAPRRCRRRYSPTAEVPTIV